MDYALEREVAKVMRGSEEHAADMTRVLEDRVHVYIPLGMRRGHFSQLLTEGEARLLRERVKGAKRSAAEARRETAAMAAEDETSTRWRAAAAAEEAAEMSRRQMAAIARAALSQWSRMRSAVFSQAPGLGGARKPGDIEDICEAEVKALLSLPSGKECTARDEQLERIRIACDALERAVQRVDQMIRSYGDIDASLASQATGRAFSVSRRPCGLKRRLGSWN